jgi:hypothetical protein
MAHRKTLYHCKGKTSNEYSALRRINGHQRRFHRIMRHKQPLCLAGCRSANLKALVRAQPDRFTGVQVWGRSTTTNHMAGGCALSRIPHVTAQPLCTRHIPYSIGSPYAIIASSAERWFCGSGINPTGTAIFDTAVKGRNASPQAIEPVERRGIAGIEKRQGTL